MPLSILKDLNSIFGNYESVEFINYYLNLNGNQINDLLKKTTFTFNGESKFELRALEYLKYKI